MAGYIQEISKETISNILRAIRQFREEKFEDVSNLSKEISAILEIAIKDEYIQKFVI